MSQHENLAAALSALQGELPAVRKEQTAKVKSDKGSYSYDYADLADVSVAIMPLLSKHGLAFTATPTFSDSGQFMLACTLLHASGESREGRYPLPSSGTPQSIGSAITYGRRYCLCAMTGVAPEGDDDGAAAEAENQAQRGTARRASAPRQQQAPAAAGGTTAKRATAKQAAPAGEPPPLPGEEPAAEAGTTSSTTPPSAYSGNGRPAGADEPATPAQLGKLGASFRESGVGRDEGLAYVASVIGRQVESTKDMTKSEASKVIDALAATPAPPPEPTLGADLEGTEA